MIEIYCALFSSIPEELLIVITNLAASNDMTFLNFKKRENILKLITAVIIMVVFSAFCEIFIKSIVLVTVARAVLYYLVIVIVYKVKLFSYILSFSLSAGIFLMTYWIFSGVLYSIFGFTSKEINSNIISITLISLPYRFIQIVTFVIVYKSKINLKVEKFKIRELITIILFFLIIIGSTYSIFKPIINNSESEIKLTIGLVLNVVILVSFSLFLFFKSYVTIRKRMLIKEKMYESDLRSIRNLLSDGKVNQVLDLIDMELKERLVKDLKEKGYFKG